MKMLEQFRSAGISDTDIINIFQFHAGSSTKIGNRSYRFSNFEKPAGSWAEIHFNSDWELYNIVPGNLLANNRSQRDFVENALNDIEGDHGYLITHRILFSQKPLKGMFQWKDDFRIKPCLNNSQIGKGLAWGIENNQNLNDTEKHLGPPYPFILEVRTKKSPNSLIETNRFLQELDSYEWLLGLLIPHLLSSSIRTSQPQWTLMKNENNPEYHLAYSGFNAYESEIETSDNFSNLDIPDVGRYWDKVDYYDHLWVRSNEIELPKEMENYLTFYDSLPTESKENFKRSLYWFNVGSGLKNRQQLSIIPYTTAIECLLPNPSIETCPTCKKPKGDGPTKLFKDFLENNLSLPEDINHLKKSIYLKRSTMVHGKFADAADYGFFSISDSDVTEFATENFIRKALVNWLQNGTFK